MRQKGADSYLSPTKLPALKCTSSTAGQRSYALPLLFGDRGQWEGLSWVPVVCHSVLVLFITTEKASWHCYWRGPVYFAFVHPIFSAITEGRRALEAGRKAEKVKKESKEGVRERRHSIWDKKQIKIKTAMSISTNRIFSWQAAVNRWKRASWPSEALPDVSRAPTNRAMQSVLKPQTVWAPNTSQLALRDISSDTSSSKRKVGQILYPGRLIDSTVDFSPKKLLYVCNYKKKNAIVLASAGRCAIRYLFRRFPFHFGNPNYCCTVWIIGTRLLRYAAIPCR